MTNIPEGAKAPEDHKAPTLQPVINEDELLADLPTLTPPTKLRPRVRNKIMKMAAKLSALAGDDGEINIEVGDANFDTMLDVLADVDEFAESIAIDLEAYVAWSEQSSYEQLSALLTRYASAVGESTSSSS